MAKIQPQQLLPLVGERVRVEACRRNTYRSRPERFAGRLVAVGRVLGSYRSAPHAIVLATDHGSVPIISLARVTRLEHPDGDGWAEVYVDPTAYRADR